MSLILCIDSATTNCSVALYKNEELVSFKEEDGTYSHAENLAVFIDEIIKKSSYTIEDISAVAISGGPGSYTGLRIGASLAKGMCYTLKIPLISIDTLEAMAFGCLTNTTEQKELLCPMIDARRMEVYTALFDHNLKELESTSAEVISSESFLSYLEKNKILFFGDGSAKCGDVITHENAIFLNDLGSSAVNLGGLAYNKYLSSDFEGLAYFEPNYLKEYLVQKSKKLV